MAGHRFETTRWSLVLAVRDRESPDAAAALATLCESYWYPVYAFIRRSGRSSDDARDLTQAFFTRVLEKGYFGQARQERGRFRSFLLASVRHFLANEHDWQQARKRGGAVTHLSLEVARGEDVYQIDPVDDATPERLYDQRWARTVLDAAMARTKRRYEKTGRADLWRRLLPYLTGDEPASYAALAAQTGATEGSLRIAVHRLRQQYAAALRDVIGETVETPDQVEDELRHLLASVGR